jgi:hypothetical protein
MSSSKAVYKNIASSIDGSVDKCEERTEKFDDALMGTSNFLFPEEII